MSLSWRRFIWRSWRNVFEAWELFWSSLRSLKTFECYCVLLCTTLLRRRVTELSNLCGLAQVRAVKKSCHAALVFSQRWSLAKGARDSSESSVSHKIAKNQGVPRTFGEWGRQKNVPPSLPFLPSFLPLPSNHQLDHVRLFRNSSSIMACVFFADDIESKRVFIHVDNTAA